MANPTSVYHHEQEGVHASSTALGLVAFGTTALVAGAVLAGWWHQSQVSFAVLTPLLFVLGGVIQVLVAMWNYARHQNLEATFFGTFGSLFAILALYAMGGNGTFASLDKMDVLGPLGLTSIAFCWVALFLAVALAVKNPGLALTSIISAISLFFLFWAFFAHANQVLIAIGGWAGLVAGVVGLITAAIMCLGQEEGSPFRIPGLSRQS